MTPKSDIIRAFIGLWNDRDLDAILAALAPDCIYHNMPWPPLIGHEAIRLARIIHPVEFGALSFKHLASSEHT